MLNSLMVWLLVALPSADAHKPSYANDHTGPDNAFEVIDPEISIALYAEMTCTEDALWLHMDTEGLDEVWLELGVPVLDRLENYRPSLAIVAEGFPDAEVPFDLPDGMGAMVIATDDVDTPIDFFEPFTQTDSWILFRDWFDVPRDSDVYLVAYNPAQFTGKLWVAVGLTEDFSDVDVSQFSEWMEKTQAFHEVGDTEEHTELDCTQLYDENSAPEVEPSTASTTSGGCSTLAHSQPVGIGLAVAAMFGIARRRRRA